MWCCSVKCSEKSYAYVTLEFALSHTMLRCTRPTHHHIVRMLLPQHYESVALLVLYGAYILLMVFNYKLMDWMDTWKVR